MSEMSLDPHIAPALEGANALITACMGNDFDQISEALPDEADGVWVILALIKLSIGLIESLAEATGEDPLLLWQRMALNSLSNLESM